LHRDLGYLGREARYLRDFYVPQLQIKLWRLKRESIQIHEVAASPDRFELKGLHEPGPFAYSTMLRRNPNLLQLTALTPCSANCPTNNLAASKSSDDVERFDVMERRSGNAVLTDPRIDNCQRIS
jgi:hypothetical protein